MVGSPDCTAEEDIGPVVGSPGCIAVEELSRSNRCSRRLLDRHRSGLEEVVEGKREVRRPIP